MTTSSLVLRTFAAATAAAVFSISSRAPNASSGTEPIAVDHYVRVRSTVPSIAGQITPIFVRERALTSTVLRASNLGNRVVLFVHGAGTPAEVAFDVPYQDYSWMAYLANAGFDVFAMDMTGYGRSARPFVMNDPCNLSSAQQALFVPSLIPAPCQASYGQQATTLASDWNDIAGVVDYIRTTRRVEKVSLVGWSLGGPRAGGYAAQHPDRIHKLVLLAPAYSANASATPPATAPAAGAAFNTQSRQEFDANWDRQVSCPGQVDPGARESVWSNMLASDPLGSTWGSGVRRAPNVTTWGWNAAMAAKVKSPTLLVAAALDVQVSAAGVSRLHTDIGAPQKLFVDLGCSSHNALWERNHLALFQASREWLERSTVNGTATGTLQLGY
jgi:pimeloyl-ACP methyl ester carboxylesterase